MTDLTKPSGDYSSVQLSRVSLVTRTQTPIKSLPGFTKKNHRVPDAFDRQSQGFVGKLGSQMVRDDLDHAFTQIRDAFKLKRREISATDSDEGFGTISTPNFLYSCCVYQHSKQVDEAVWQRDISQIAEPELLLDEDCNRLFAQTFDTVEFLPPTTIDLEKLIDHIEDLADGRIKADYNREVTYCNIIIGESDPVIRVTRDTFLIVHSEPSPPSVLVTSIRDVQRDLIDFAQLT